jgi:endonuclease YncB( thermonuclease family)
MSGWDNAPEYGAARRWSAIGAYVGVFLLVLAVAMCSGASRADNTVIAGVASVVDGDTIEIHGTRIRLSGIDAPEHDRRCGSVRPGQQSALALDDLVRGHSLRCEVSGLDHYGRSVATCFVGNTDIGGVMVEQGQARDWPRYSHRAYAAQEQAARNAHRGVWAQACQGLWGDRNYD